MTTIKQLNGATLTIMVLLFMSPSISANEQEHNLVNPNEKSGGTKITKTSQQEDASQHGKKGSQKEGLEANPIVVTKQVEYDTISGSYQISTDIVDHPNTLRLGDVVNWLPGVFFDGPPGENRELVMGMDKDTIRFELEGMQLPDSGEKREFQYNRLSLFGIERIVVLKSPTSEYESDGMGGRIVAEMGKIPEKRIIEYNMSLGGSDGLNWLEFGNEIGSIGIRVGDRVNNYFGYNIFFDYQRFTLERYKTNDSFGTDGKLTGTSIEERSQPSQNFHFKADLAWFYKQGEFHIRPLVVSLDEQSEKETNKYKNDNLNGSESTDQSKVEKMYGISVASTHRFKNNLIIKSDAGYFKTKLDDEQSTEVFKSEDDGLVFNKTNEQDKKVDDSIWQLRSKLIAPFKLWLQQEIRTGFAVRQHERSNNKNVLQISPDGTITDKGTASDDFDLNETYLAFFFQDSFFINRFTITPGVRLEYVYLDATSSDETNSTEDFFDANPSLHLLVNITKHWAINASFSRTLNRPEFKQLVPFVDEEDDRFTQGNPDLKPATSWNFNAGVVWNNEYLLFGLSLFHKEIEDVIEEVDTGTDLSDKDIYRFENVGNGYLQGIELEQRLDLSLFHRLLSGLQIWSNVTLFRSFLDRSDGQTSRLDKQPVTIINLGGRYRLNLSGTSLSVFAKFIGEVANYKDSEQREVIPGRWEMDITLNQEIGQYGSLFFDALNVLDTHHEKDTFTDDIMTQQQIESVGRTFIFGLNVRL